jgi:hypothetical protein
LDEGVEAEFVEGVEAVDGLFEVVVLGALLKSQGDGVGEFGGGPGRVRTISS